MATFVTARYLYTRTWLRRLREIYDFLANFSTQAGGTLKRRRRQYISNRNLENLSVNLQHTF